ncbi:Glycosyltransferase involved in cell wall bisynthesis [Roseomonas rosea]|uniref:Glycosyltransferase involved in cell wall bisynthesis n=1 Tax=Muricoccus roseus TaxID=198092 RepID=A0A1M6EXU8_9PROT|nr:glycosyltransferase [Roseomonas rosea]SHI90201.1 Glycosyltransferase involved in cell wall bisynthesis [Roseomonas rosea]
MRNPSVCVIAHAHPDFSKGGGETAAYRQFQTLAGEGWEASFVAAIELPGGQSPSDRGEAVARYGENEYLYAVSGMEDDRLWWRSAEERRGLVRLLAGLNADVYHFHHYWRVGLDLVAELAEARPDARMVVTLHEMLAICSHHGQMIRTRSRELCRKETAQRCLTCFPDQTLERLRLRKALMISGLRSFDHFVYPSHFIAERYRAWGLSPDKATVLENYLGDDLLALPRRRRESARLAGRFAFFGQPTEFKGLDILIPAFASALAEDPALGLMVYGATEEETLRFFPHLERSITAAGDRIVFAGRYDAADVVALMSSIGWVIMPSIWWENSPVVIQEARRAGTPLMVSGIGGMAEKVLDGVDGLHFRAGSVPDLTRAMLEGAVPENHERLSSSLRDVIGREEFIGALRGIYAAEGEPVMRAA